MNTAVAVNTSNMIPLAMSAFQDIPLNRIQESKTNPRRTFDETKLAELAGNIRQHGVLQPVLVRPLPGGEDGFFELVAGARRYRASRMAERETIPATVRELTDTECLELQLIENLQRADVHELDEARGYATLMQLQPENYTVETLAEKIGRSEKYVYARLRLMHLIQEAQEAFYIGRLTVAHAFEIARLQPFCGVRRYVALRMRGQLGRRTERLRCHIIPIRSSGSGKVPVWPDRKTLLNWVLSGLSVIRPSEIRNEADSPAKAFAKALGAFNRACAL